MGMGAGSCGGLWEGFGGVRCGVWPSGRGRAGEGWGWQRRLSACGLGPWYGRRGAAELAVGTFVRREGRSRNPDSARQPRPPGPCEAVPGGSLPTALPPNGAKGEEKEGSPWPDHGQTGRPNRVQPTALPQPPPLVFVGPWWNLPESSFQIFTAPPPRVPAPPPIPRTKGRLRGSAQEVGSAAGPTHNGRGFLEPVVPGSPGDRGLLPSCRKLPEAGPWCDTFLRDLSRGSTYPRGFSPGHASRSPSRPGKASPVRAFPSPACFRRP